MLSSVSQPALLVRSIRLSVCTRLTTRRDSSTIQHQYQQQHRHLSVHTKSDYSYNGLPGINQWTSPARKTPEAQRKELLWRAKQRGILELDLLVGTYAKNNIHKWSAADITDFERLLTLESPEFLAILLKKQPVDAEIDCEVLRGLMEYTHEQKKAWSANTGNQNEEYVERQ